MVITAKSNFYRTGSARGQSSVPGPDIREDLIGQVGFHDRGFVMTKPTSAFSPWLQERSANLHRRIGGNGTNMTDGLRVALQLVSKAPRSMYRRIWLLSDGYPNRETDSLARVVSEARNAWTNINTVGIGDNYAEKLLRQIAGATHNGKFVSVQSLRQLTDALVIAENGSAKNRQFHRREMTVFAIDLSGSMTMGMEGHKTRIAVVEEALLHLLKYKQTCFA